MAKSPRAADVSTDRESNAAQPAANTGGNRDRIAQRAYERYEERGREDGRDQEDWFEAEREFKQPTSGTTTDDARGRGDDESA